MWFFYFSTVKSPPPPETALFELPIGRAQCFGSRQNFFPKNQENFQISFFFSEKTIKQIFNYLKHWILNQMKNSTFEIFLFSLCYSNAPLSWTYVFFAPKTLGAFYGQIPCAGKTVKFSKLSDISKIVFGNYSGKFQNIGRVLCQWGEYGEIKKRCPLGGGGLCIIIIFQWNYDFQKGSKIKKNFKQKKLLQFFSDSWDELWFPILYYNFNSKIIMIFNYIIICQLDYDFQLYYNLPVGLWFSNKNRNQLKKTKTQIKL